MSLLGDAAGGLERATIEGWLRRRAAYLERRAKEPGHGAAARRILNARAREVLACAIALKEGAAR